MPKGIIKESIKIIFRTEGTFFHKEFVKNNKNKIKIIYQNKEYELCSSIHDIDKNFNDDMIDIKLKVIGTLTNLSYMFSGVDFYYLEDISKLNTSKVTDMSYLFHQNIYYHFDNNWALDWDTSNVQNMSYLFSETFCPTFPDISKWNTSKVTNMKGMFAFCNGHTTLPDISKWNVSNVTDMSNLFHGLRSDCLPDISKWNTSKVTNMDELFDDVSIQKTPDISNWNTSNVTSMSSMFLYFCCGCNIKEYDELKDFPDISKWNVANVTNMNHMFALIRCKKFPDISKWNVANVINMNHMFAHIHCKKFPDISKWNVAKVKYMYSMFYSQNVVNPFMYISNWDVSNVIESDEFYDGFSLKDAKNMDEYLKKKEEEIKRWENYINKSN